MNTQARKSRPPADEPPVPLRAPVGSRTQRERPARPRVRNQLPLEEVLDPYLEKFGAIFGGVLFALTLVAILVTNALHVGYGVFIITVPAAFMMLCRDLIYDWWTRTKATGMEIPSDAGRDSDIEPGRVR
jgi:hypothetical protein